MFNELLAHYLMQCLMHCLLHY